MKRIVVAVFAIFGLTLAPMTLIARAAPPALQELTDPCLGGAPTQPTFGPVVDEQRVEGFDTPVSAATGFHVNSNGERFWFEVYGPDRTDVETYVNEVKVCIALTSFVEEPEQAPEATPVESEEVVPDLVIDFDFDAVIVVDEGAKDTAELLFALYKDGVPIDEWPVRLNESRLQCSDSVWTRLATTYAAGQFPDSPESLGEFITSIPDGGCFRLEIPEFPEGTYSAVFSIDPGIAGGKYHQYKKSGQSVRVTVSVTSSGSSVKAGLKESGRTASVPPTATLTAGSSFSSVSVKTFHLCIRGNGPSSRTNNYALAGSWNTARGDRPTVVQRCWVG